MASHGRIYNILHSIADCIEWTGAKIFQLINRPAQMLGITSIDDTITSLIQNQRESSIRCTCISFIGRVISLPCGIFGAMLVKYPILCYLNIFTIFLCSLNCIYHSKIIAFLVAKRIRRMRRVYFR